LLAINHAVQKNPTHPARIFSCSCNISVRPEARRKQKAILDKNPSQKAKNFSIAFDFRVASTK